MDCRKYFYSIVFVVLGSVFSFGQVDEKEPPVVVPTVQEVAETYDADVSYPIAVLDEPPLLKTCIDVSKADALKCLYEQIQKHVKKNLKYPKEAKEIGIQGKVAVVFIIDKEGNCKDFKARGPKNGQLLEEEAIRIMKLLPKLTPGKVKGKLVNVHYAVPILFQLDKPVRKR
ncbi:energy transducer TonB [Flavobacterium capsici]|uniref:Energy transducer TonB n=1 Tax=Flavobacterium capsici TaxID=3075618 RepID=A0AA96F2E4_9FLAO|nr:MULTISPECIES: energy transducer TonB [unclassified Flavobacterium]WNM20111.1 energy transducer TonB [Flavobacterium sp. PMR2A8]WNM21501.1 energy transducer TonB [Flavobacterium sp. PMTSA4]